MRILPRVNMFAYGQVLSAWVDAFGASVVRIMDGEFDKSGNGNFFGGVYAVATALVPKSSVEPY